MDCIVKINHLTKIYRDFTAVSGASLHIRPGSIYGFLRSNGTGKSAAMKVLLESTRPTSGSFRVAGKHFPADRIEILRSIGSFIESPSFYVDLTGRENLEIIRRILDLPRSSVSEALELMGSRGFGGCSAQKYSLDMEQRLGLARTMLGEPPVLFLNKPTSRLNPVGIHEICNLVTSLPSRYGCTVLITSHLLAEAGLMAQDIGILNHGRMLFGGSLEALRGLAVHEGLAESSLEDTFLAMTEDDNATHQEKALL